MNGYFIILENESKLNCYNMFNGEIIDTRLFKRDYIIMRSKNQCFNLLDFNLLDNYEIDNDEFDCGSEPHFKLQAISPKQFMIKITIEFGHDFRYLFYEITNDGKIIFIHGDINSASGYDDYLSSLYEFGIIAQKRFNKKLKILKFNDIDIVSSSVNIDPMRISYNNLFRDNNGNLKINDHNPNLIIIPNNDIIDKMGSLLSKKIEKNKHFDFMTQKIDNNQILFVEDYSSNNNTQENVIFYGLKFEHCQDDTTNMPIIHECTDTYDKPLFNRRNEIKIEPDEPDETDEIDHNHENKQNDNVNDIDNDDIVIAPPPTDIRYINIPPVVRIPWTPNKAATFTDANVPPVVRIPWAPNKVAPIIPNVNILSTDPDINNITESAAEEAKFAEVNIDMDLEIMETKEILKTKDQNQRKESDINEKEKYAAFSTFNDVFDLIMKFENSMARSRSRMFISDQEYSINYFDKESLQSIVTIKFENDNNFGHSDDENENQSEIESEKCDEDWDLNHHVNLGLDYRDIEELKKKEEYLKQFVHISIKQKMTQDRDLYHLNYCLNKMLFLIPRKREINMFKNICIDGLNHTLILPLIEIIINYNLYFSQII